MRISWCRRKLHQQRPEMPHLKAASACRGTGIAEFAEAKPTRRRVLSGGRHRKRALAKAILLLRAIAEW